MHIFTRYKFFEHGQKQSSGLYHYYDFKLTACTIIILTLQDYGICFLGLFTNVIPDFVCYSHK
jgi:hypothetical protein